MKQEKLPESFISYAASILGATDTGLRRTELVKQCTKFAVKYNVDIPVATTDWGDFGSKVPNKQTAMFQNLNVFSKDEQVAIIRELTELPSFKDNPEAQELHRLLLERYCPPDNIMPAPEGPKTVPIFQNEVTKIENAPKVFISYSWEDEAHNAWVKKLADRLLENGVEAILDQYDLALGDRMPQFMENSLTNSDFVLVICTPRYKVKSDGREGGAGYEGNIISGELFYTGNERKFIPIIRKGDFKTSLPLSLAGKRSLDLRDGPDYENNFQQLITTISGKAQKPKVTSHFNSSEIANKIQF